MLINNPSCHSVCLGFDRKTHWRKKMQKMNNILVLI